MLAVRLELEYVGLCCRFGAAASEFQALDDSALDGKDSVEWENGLTSLHHSW